MTSSKTRRAAHRRTTATASPEAASSRQPATALAAAGVQPPAAAAPASVSVVFHLDAVEHEATGAPFTFDIPYLSGDRVWRFRAPEELNWLENSVAVQFAAMDDLRPFLRQILGGQYDEFVTLPLTIGQVQTLIARWQRHHGITLPESSASRRS